MAFSTLLRNSEEDYLHLLARAKDIELRMGWTTRESMMKAFLFISAEKRMYRKWDAEEKEFAQRSWRNHVVPEPRPRKR